MVTHGSKALLFVKGVNVSDYLTTLGVNLERDTAEVTTIGSEWKKHIPGLKDSSIPIGGPAFTEAADHLWQLLYQDAPAYFEYAPSGYDGGPFFYGYALLNEFGISSGVDDPNDLVGNLQVTGDVKRATGYDFNSDGDVILDFNEIEDGDVFDGNI